jgi:LacI family transcriptional regulator, repressor for deo operon, udp, cdd, tsx, nupC, and nupG
VPRSGRPTSATQPTRSSIVDVARLAGVSVATVSRALRGLPNVSEATRERVLHAAAELEYIASPLAAALVTGRTRSVGVIASAAAPWFFTEAVCGIEATLRDAGYDVLLHVLPDAERREHFFRGLPMHRRIDGLVLVGLRLTGHELEALRGLRVPLAAVAEELPGVHTERIDNRAAGALAVRHLLELGHTRIALIGGSPEELRHDEEEQLLPDAGTAPSEPVVPPRRPLSAPAARTLGALAELEAAGLEPVAVEDGGFTPSAAAAAMSRLLDAGARPTAVFCESDEMAFGVLHSLRQRGLHCPADVSVIGFDDHELAGAFDLTTVAQPVARQGSAAARWLVDELAGGVLTDGAPQLPAREHEVKLRVRATTAPPAG